ncbi:hypothetical protein PUNSTDRAFT_146617 [Punctularia strigosozonata HHB-11173 SS5]|uniref:Uncharacterized protein n=1 Tax=Punctularia strigosozonata (strain HHB-11173) TaxID=741275 RepID=R7S140_PUNST|nr:uncharacterized protein PUNSTDRAFT_146617 [Punctularia strigosozonata HHB-11173 SS5]EIN04095.1 hypothetical protein PUNSTDRAFT_146617 [Punctularia strigosozonata HHB-11173 SS5]
MKFSSASVLALLASVATLCATAPAPAVTAEAADAVPVHTYTMTRIINTLIPEPPYLTEITKTIVFTEYATPTPN